jgi:hypothetical protein
MSKINPFLILVFIFIFLVSGCSPAATVVPGAPEQSAGQTSPPAGEAAPVVFNRDAWDSYSAVFQIQFTGPVSWIYRLTTRKSSTLEEYNLHIEGIESGQNPGDIRLVTDGIDTWMIGAGTGNECIQYPNNQGMDPTFLSPELLAAPGELGAMLRRMGEEPLAGVMGQHYQTTSTTVGPWNDAQVDVWMEPSSNMLLMMTMKASGDDPFFGTGSGEISVLYAAGPPEDKTIETISGCEISVPLPESAVMFVRLPGMASFESADGADEISNFYQTILPQEEWSESEPLALAGNTSILSYRRGTEVVEIYIEQAPSGGSKIQLLFLPE